MVQSANARLKNGFDGGEIGEYQASGYEIIVQSGIHPSLLVAVRQNRAISAMVATTMTTMTTMHTATVAGALSVENGAGSFSIIGG